MASLGELERSVMDYIWSSDATVTAYDVQAELADKSSKALAVTTVLTVLSRLEKKGFVRRERTSRPHGYVAVSTRNDHVASLMHEVLGSSSDRRAVLERFVGQTTPDEAAALRKMLDGR
jgi:predicted transcriptional regulator